MNNIAGWITFKTKADNKDLKRDLKLAEQELKDSEKKLNSTKKEKIKIDVDLEEYNRKMAELEEIHKETMQTLTSSEHNFTQDAVDFEKSQFSKSQEKLNSEYSGTIQAQNELNEKVKYYEQLIEKNKNRVNELKNKIDDMNDTGFDDKKLKNFGKSLTRIVKRTAQWGLRLVGIAGVYGLFSNAVSQLERTNKKLKDDIDYMRFAIGSALEPVIRKIVGWVYQLLQLVNSLVYSMSGYNMFANASSDAFKKSLNTANKLKKTLAGFDEMNVVSSSSGASANNSSLDLSVIDEEKVQKAKEFFDDIIKFWEEDINSYFGNVGGYWSAFIDGILMIFQGVYYIFKGIIEMIVGLWDMLVAVFTGDLEKLKEGWDLFCKGLWDIIYGVLETILGLIVSVVGIVKGLVIELIGSIKNIILGIVDFFVGIWDIIVEGAKWLWEKIVDIFQSMVDNVKLKWNLLVTGAKGAWEGIKSVFSKVGTFFSDTFKKAWQKVKDVFSKGGQIFSGIKDGIVDAFKTIVNKLIDGINTVVSKPFNSLNSTLNKIRDVDILGVKPFSKLWSKNPIGVPKIPRLAKGGIINLPGRGVALGGELGPEGVIPLTDSQQMERLGEAIGRYITVNLTNNTNLDGRVIARQTSKISSNTNFIRNR